MRSSRYELRGDDPVAVAELAARIRELSPPPPRMREQVDEIVAAVWERGDSALVELTRRLDGVALSEDALAVSAAELTAAVESLSGPLRESLEVAIANVRGVAESQLEISSQIELQPGHTVESRALPVKRAAAYVPGGRAAYPSTVIMCAVPAAVAGVEEFVVCTPPNERGDIDPTVLAACALCGVSEVYRVGGAQAIAALGYGTESIAAVELIVGPGNAYVQEAKRQLVGTVGIDGIAGPSELMAIADATADPRLVALDLAAQAEHGPESLLVLATDSDTALERIESEALAISTENESVTAAPLAVVRVDSLATAARLANAIAPEHLELACSDADELTRAITAAGCVFVGHTGAAAFGDYAAGSNHVLPTGGAARFTGPLSPNTFRHRMSVVSISAAAAERLAPHVGNLARAEGYEVHAQSAEARRKLHRSVEQ